MTMQLQWEKIAEYWANKNNITRDEKIIIAKYLNKHGPVSTLNTMEAMLSLLDCLYQQAIVAPRMKAHLDNYDRAMGVV